MEEADLWRRALLDGERLEGWGFWKAWQTMGAKGWKWETTSEPWLLYFRKSREGPRGNSLRSGLMGVGSPHPVWNLWLPPAGGKGGLSKNVPVPWLPLPGDRILGWSVGPVPK